MDSDIKKCMVLSKFIFKCSTNIVLNNDNCIKMIYCKCVNIVTCERHVGSLVFSGEK